MPTFTVISASLKKVVPGAHGPLQIVNLVLDDGTATPVQCETRLKEQTPLPTQGQQLEGTLEHNQYGTLFKRDFTPGAGGGGGGGGGGWQEDPQRSRRIVRQHSQTAALQCIELAVKYNIIEKPANSQALFALLKLTINWFDSDAFSTEQERDA